jgi:Spy/CpxP family protein refolding chaperone
MRTALIVSMAVLLANPLVLAQRGVTDAQRGGDDRRSGKWWFDPKIRESLHLTDQQIASLDRIFEAAMPHQRESWLALRRAEDELSRLMKAESRDDVKIIASIERVEFARYKHNERRMILLFRLSQELTHAQRLEFDRISRKRRDTGRNDRRGPGR